MVSKNNKEPQFTKLVTELKGEAAYTVLAQATALEKQGKKIIHLEIGQPDFKTPDHITQAAIDALHRGETRYSAPLGLMELRKAVADDVNKEHKANATFDEVAIMPSAKMGLYLSMVATLEPGDEVIYPDPGFPAYENVTRLLGCVPKPLPLLEKNNFSFDINTFKKLIGPKTKLIILNSPSNPTGGVIPKKDLEVIAELAIKYNAWVLTDEIYTKIAYDRIKVPSIYTLPRMKERTLLVNGFSKTYAMAGWRLGYVVLPKRLVPIMDSLMVNSFACTATFIQRAGVEALTQAQDEVHAMVAEFEKRRNIIVERLNKIPGFSCVKPEGAFYAFPNITKTGKTSAELATYLLEEAGVAILPGTAFGQYGEGYLRISYANSLENINAALDKIEVAMRKLK